MYPGCAPGRLAQSLLAHHLFRSYRTFFLVRTHSARRVHRVVVPGASVPTPAGALVHLCAASLPVAGHTHPASPGHALLAGQAAAVLQLLPCLAGYLIANWRCAPRIRNRLTAALPP